MAKKAFGATFEAGNQKPHRLVFIKKAFVGLKTQRTFCKNYVAVFFYGFAFCE
jgi:hypothetical protein